MPKLNHEINALLIKTLDLIIILTSFLFLFYIFLIIKIIRSFAFYLFVDLLLI